MFNSDGTQVNGSPFATGNTPAGIAFDGGHMWIANDGAGTVSVLNTDGTQAPGSPLTAGTNPAGVAFDGTHIWVTNGYSDSVTVFNIA